MKELKKLGIRTKESTEFLRFFDIVQEAAKEKESVFFLDSGEGHEITDENINAEDLTGWLVPSDEVLSFNQFFIHFKDNELDDKFGKFYVFASWQKKDGKFIVNFE